MVSYLIFNEINKINFIQCKLYFLDTLQFTILGATFAAISGILVLL